MKTIYFLRHGKAERRKNDSSDLKRKLIPLGITETKKTIELLKRKSITGFDLILTSPAVRATKTANMIIDSFEMQDPSIRFEELLYTIESCKELLDFIRHLDNSKSSVLLIGHNPVLSDTVQLFIPEMKTPIPTSGVVRLSFDINSWEEITNAKPSAKFFGIKIKKRRKPVLTAVERNDVREKTISFAFGIFKELGVKTETVEEERLKLFFQRMYKDILSFIREIRSVTMATKRSLNTLKEREGMSGRSSASGQESNPPIEDKNFITLTK